MLLEDSSPSVDLHETIDSYCNHIPLYIFQCKVYGIDPNGSSLVWYVNISGKESEKLKFINENDFRKEENISGYNLTAMLPEHNKILCTEPTLISTLIILPPIIPNITENLSPITVSCEVDHTSLAYPINDTTQRHQLNQTGKLLIVNNNYH